LTRAVLRPITQGASANTSEVDLMHVLHRPHLPRLITVSIAAAVMAIVISLALASSLSNVSQPGENPSVSAHRAVPAPTSALHTNAPPWVSDPFASLLTRPLPQPWPTAGG
jgi:hypothetical protein